MIDGYRYPDPQIPYSSAARILKDKRRAELVREFFLVGEIGPYFDAKLSCEEVNTKPPYDLAKLLKNASNIQSLL